MHHDPAVRQGQRGRQAVAPDRQQVGGETGLHPDLRQPHRRPRPRAHRRVRVLGGQALTGGQQVRRLQRVAPAHRVRHVPQRAAARRHPYARRAQQPYRRRVPAVRRAAAALGQAHHRHPGRREPLRGTGRYIGREGGQAPARPERHPGPQTARHRREPGQPGRVGRVGVQIDRQPVLGGRLQHRLHIARGIGVEVRAAAHHGGAHLHRVPQHRETVRPGQPRQHPGHRHRGQLGQPAQRTRRPQHGPQRAEPRHVPHAHVRAQGRRPVPELEQCRLRRPALHVLGVLGDGAGAVGGQGGVRVGVRIGRGQQQIAGEVEPRDARARGVRREAARRADGLDAPAAEPYVHAPAVAEARAAQEERGRVGRAGTGGRGPRLGRWLRPVVGHRAPGARAAHEDARHAETRSRRVSRA